VWIFLERPIKKEQDKFGQERALRCHHQSSDSDSQSRKRWNVPASIWQYADEGMGWNGMREGWERSVAQKVYNPDCSTVSIYSCWASHESPSRIFPWPPHCCCCMARLDSAVVVRTGKKS
jgi:hypothetical protein